MDAKDDIELLRDYATGRSETAFTSLVQRHIHFVYSSALRQVYNAHLAEEVTQAVFIILARKAGSLRQGTILAGWLFNTARFVAAAELRAIARRHKHEQEAGMESTPVSYTHLDVYKRQWFGHATSVCPCCTRRSGCWNKPGRLGRGNSEVFRKFNRSLDKTYEHHKTPNCRIVFDGCRDTAGISMAFCRTRPPGRPRPQ